MRRGGRRARSSSEAEPELVEAERRHLEEEPAVRKAADLRVAVRARAVPDGQVDDLHVEARGAEQEIEVAEGIEVAEEGAVAGDAIVVLFVEDLRAAERVLD